MTGLGDATKKAVESGLRDLSLGAMGYHCASPNQLRPSVDCVGFSCILIVMVVVIVVDFVALTGARCFQTTATS